MAEFPDFFERHARSDPGARRTAEGTDNAGVWDDFRGGAATATPVIVEAREARLPAAVSVPGEPSPRGALGTTVDRIAAYVPWHYDAESWGIYFWSGELSHYAAELARSAGTDQASALDFAALTVLEHEYKHFEVEVAATELEAVLDRALYDPYCMSRYRRPESLGCPLEEAVATAAEVALADRLGAPWGGLADALRQSKSLQLPGYKDWQNVAGRRGRRIGRTALRRVLCDEEDETTTANMPLKTTLAERSSVPIYWQNLHGGSLPSVFFPKSHAPVTINDLEDWLRRCGFTLDPSAARGDHVGVIAMVGSSRVKVAEYDSGGSRRAEFYRAQAGIVARKLRVGTASDLYALIRSGSMIDVAHVVGAVR